MALLALEGVYDGGKIELKEQPVDVKRARVVVTFLAEEDSTADDEERRAAAQRMIKRMRHGVNFGGERFNREDIYGERIDRIAE